MESIEGNTKRKRFSSPDSDDIKRPRKPEEMLVGGLKSEQDKNATEGDTRGNVTSTNITAGGKENFVFFYRTESPFSQFHSCEFTVNGIKYTCAEQYMMHQKAVVFGDMNMAKEILKQTKPLLMKRCGRKVKNFQKDVWNKKSLEVVKKGNTAKFSQNCDLKKALFDTYPKILAEASPRDLLWGIGLGATNPKAWNKSTWRGKNLLGICLTEVRDSLMKDAGAI